MKFYITGGWVRDYIMDVDSKDRDFVVVGGSYDQMIEMGFLPIAAQSFPIFHHPISGDEYALARVERKVGNGYHGFECDASSDITVEQDLSRRDLTCNSMAIEVTINTNGEPTFKTGQIIDPYGGREDIKNRVLRHTSIAFREDPVRVLRIARFAARYLFQVHPDTIKLMFKMVNNHELEYLNAERVWKEMERGLMEDHPEYMFQTLSNCGAIYTPPLIHYKDWFPLTALLDQEGESPIHVRFASVASAFNYSTKDYHKYRIPTECAMLSKIVNMYAHDKVPSYPTLAPSKRLEMLQGIGAIGVHRNSNIFDEFKFVVTALYKTRNTEKLDAVVESLELMTKHRRRLLSVNLGVLIALGQFKVDNTIGQQVHEYYESLINE